MCGRYTLITPEKILAQRFVLDQVPSWRPRYNLGPTQKGLIVRRESTAPDRTASRLRWGLIPHWTHRGSQPSILINARSETAADKPAFRDPFRHRRCLVLADGFIEWSRRSGEKMPYLFSMNDGRPFAMAGLWDQWQPDRDEPQVETYTILTTTANAVVEPFHDRMPVILDDEESEAWLDPYLVAPTPLARLLRTFASSEMRGRPINPRVNSIQHDDPSCLEPPPPPPQPDRPANAQLDLGI